MLLSLLSAKYFTSGDIKTIVLLSYTIGKVIGLKTLNSSLETKESFAINIKKSWREYKYSITKVSLLNIY